MRQCSNSQLFSDAAKLLNLSGNVQIEVLNLNLCGSTRYLDSSFSSNYLAPSAKCVKYPPISYIPRSYTSIRYVFPSAVRGDRRIPCYYGHRKFINQHHRKSRHAELHIQAYRLNFYDRIRSKIHLRLGFPSCLFPQRFRTEFFILFHICCPPSHSSSTSNNKSIF